MFKILNKSIKNFINYRVIDLDPVEYLVLENLNLVYVVISKVACTSIKATIGKTINIDYKLYSGLDIHKKNAWHREFGNLKYPYSDYFKFSFVRNPYTRLVSCYIDRVIYKGPNDDFPEYYFDSYPFGIPPNISFHEFIHRIVKIPDYLADRHFKSQSYSLFRKNRKFQIDFIGKYEQMGHDWSVIANKYNFSKTLGELNKGNRHNDTFRDYRAYYDKELVELVYEKYKADFELFGYQNSHKELCEFLGYN